MARTEVAAVTRPRVIVDCDPGHDDVVAIVLAAAECDLAGITTVAGNAPLEWCTRNALATVELLGLDVEVHPGADRRTVARGSAGAPNAHVALGVDGPSVIELIRRAVERAGTPSSR